METEVATAAGGSLASVGNSLANVGTAAKAFALAHPMGMAAAGGALLGMSAYYAIGKMFKKKDIALVQAAPAAA
ncbi:MAG: hypothetical protein R3E93_06370 [Thiothrix sp.]